MAVELKQALLKAGGNNSLCSLCRPAIEDHVPIIGLQERKVQDLPNGKIKLRNKLSDIINTSDECWACGWLLLLVKSRCPESFAIILPGDYERVYMGIEPRNMGSFEKGRDMADAYHDIYNLIQICIYLDPRDISREFEYFLYLQQSAEQPLKLPDLLDGTESLKWPTHMPYESRIRPPEADLRIGKRWKDYCLENHGGICSQTKVLEISQGSGLRLVDVTDRCIVQLPDYVPWVALSYCWGGEQKHSLRKDNLVTYSTPGALTEERLPPVIFDAMIATQSLGERYIWIDSLCIVQDDGLDKAKYLPVMDAIYAHAVITIINAASGDTSSGLPGIRNPITRRVQEPFELNGVWLTETLDPRHGYYSGYLETCKWSTRGWTFQEGLLSRRCLIFTVDQIYWQCHNSTWCEGSFWEVVDGVQIYRHFYGDNLLTCLTDSTIEKWAPVYISVVQMFILRDFTFDGDLVHALTGVFRVLESSTGEEYFWGLPIKSLEQALTWTTGSVSPRDSRHTYISPEGKLLSCGFPSWSWVGWRTKRLGLGAIQPSITQGVLNLRFYRLSVGGVPEPLLKTWPPPPDLTIFTDTRQQTRYPPSATHPWLDSTRQTITAADISPSIASSSLAPSLLCFWTSVATLRVEHRGQNGYWNRPHIVMCETQGDSGLAGKWSQGEFGTRPDAGDFDLGLPEWGKFVVVAATRQRMSHGGALTLTLVMVESAEGDAVAELGMVCRRKYMVQEVMESEWEKLQSKRWELVLMI